MKKNKIKIIKIKIIKKYKMKKNKTKIIKINKYKI